MLEYGSWAPPTLTQLQVQLSPAYLGVPDSIPHDVLPVLVHLLEEPALLGHLLEDVLRGEDGLQVQPLGLDLEEGGGRGEGGGWRGEVGRRGEGTDKRVKKVRVYCGAMFG